MTPMSLLPAPPTSLAILEETVTVRVADLYELLTRKGLPMTEPKTRGTKRGYRRVSMMLSVAEYNRLAAQAEEQTRTPDQQALFLLRRVLTDTDTNARQGPGLAHELDGLLPDDIPDSLADEDDAVPEPLER